MTTSGRGCGGGRTGSSPTSSPPVPRSSGGGKSAPPPPSPPRGGGGAVAGRMELIQRCRGAARTDRTHEGRARAVLRWLEQLDGNAAASGVEARIDGPAATVTGVATPTAAH